MINTGEMVVDTFYLWYKGGVIDGKVYDVLSKYTDFDNYDGPADFFRAYGLLGNNGEITDEGKQILKEVAEDSEGESLNINNLELPDLNEAEAEPAGAREEKAGEEVSSVGSHSNEGDDSKNDESVADLEANETEKEFMGAHSNSDDDRRDPEHEPARLTVEEWKNAGYYAAKVKADPGDADKAKVWTVKSYEEYAELRDYIHEEGYFITAERFATETEYFPGLLTYEGAVKAFETADDRTLFLKSFPAFSKTAKIHIHDSVVLAADTGAGKSSLAINFLNDLNDEYPVLYFNLEMDNLTILRRLVGIRTGLNIDDTIAEYKNNEKAAEAVNAALKAITSRKPLQVLTKARTLNDIEKNIARATEDREEPTVVIIDHSLLVRTGKSSNSRYDRFTEISETLRRVSLEYNIILFILLQQNRAGKEDEEKRPKNSSLKESGSWENDATHICFLWYDPTAQRKKILITKNRHGDTGEFTLNYWKTTQRYCESKDQPAKARTSTKSKPKQTKRDREREELENAYISAMITTDGNPTLYDLAEILDLKAETVKKRIKEYGLGFVIDGKTYDEAAGSADSIEYTGFTKATPGERAYVEEQFQERI